MKERKLSRALMISNTVAVKIIQIGGFFFTGAIFIFPLTYIFGDILTEVYGYKASRKIIWSGLIANIIMSLGYFLVQSLPSAHFWPNQGAYEMILGIVPRVVLASIVGYLFKVFYEVLATPLTYLIVSKLKKAEGVDVYDIGVNYNPFSLKK